MRWHMPAPPEPPAPPRYREFAPPPDLSPYVRCFWQIAASAAPPTPNRICPDGSADLVFTGGRLCVVGTMRTAVVVPLSGAVASVRDRCSNARRARARSIARGACGSPIPEETRMSQQPQLVSAEHDGRVDYVEFGAPDLPAIKRFYTEAFGWEFTDYGPEYTSFVDGRLSGGFRRMDPGVAGGPLVVIFALELERTAVSVTRAGGRIVRPTFSFPGGRRFHFVDPAGNELAVWSDRPG
jgi:predicted enzyme related to lactoylglutathione lyase